MRRCDPRLRGAIGLVLVLVLMAAAGAAALVAVDASISMPRLRERVAEAGADGAFAESAALGFAHSHFSDCEALSVALSGVAPGPAFSVRSRAILWRPGSSLCDSLLAAVADPAAVPWFDYGRYWHGYRVVLFPLVEAAGYRGAQAVLFAAATAALAVLAICLIPVSGWMGGLAGFVLLAGLGGFPFAAVTPTHAISILVLVLGAGTMAACASRWRETMSRRLVLVAFGIGCAYAYVDFFYNPSALSLLAGGLAVVAGMRDRVASRADAVHGALLAAATLGGVLAMWATKWILGTPFALLGGADWPVLPGDFSRWGAGGDAGYVPLAASIDLVATALGSPWRFAVALVPAAMWILAWRRDPAAARPLLIAVLAPIAVGACAIEAASGHSIAHAAFTFRVVPCALALLAVAAGSLLSQAPRRR